MKSNIKEKYTNGAEVFEKLLLLRSEGHLFIEILKDFHLQKFYLKKIYDFNK